MAHTHRCPHCGARWECNDANYQDECPYPTEVVCTGCRAKQVRQQERASPESTAGEQNQERS